MKQITWIVFGGLFLMGTAQAASFDCGRASSKMEKLICSDPQLSKNDDDLAVLYAKALKEAPDPAALKKQQREWLSDVRKRCDDVPCLRDAYTSRMTQLASGKNASIQERTATFPPKSYAKYMRLIDLGDGGGERAEIEGISADGFVIVGSIIISEERPENSVKHPFRWTQAGGFQDLSTADDEFAGAARVSADGSVIVGYTDGLPFRWTQAGGRQYIAASSADDVSADGSVIVGRIGPADNSQVYRWTQEGGVQNIGAMGGKSAWVGGVSADGLVVIGTITINENESHAFRWTQADGFQDLGTMGGRFTAAHAVSADGSVIVGEIGMANGTHIFLWSKADGAVDLGAMGGKSPYPASVSADGATIVGSVIMNDGSSHAFRWTQNGGAQDLGTLGGTYVTVVGASADGSIIVGSVISGNKEHAIVAPLNKMGQVIIK